MDNLDFLSALTKLTEFHLAIPAVNEDGLAAEGVYGFEALAGSKVNSFRVCGKDSPDAREKL